MKSRIKHIRGIILAGIICLSAAVLSSPYTNAAVAPLSFTDNAIDGSSTIIHIGTSEPSNTFRYLISSDANAVPAPDLGTDLSAWTEVTDGSIIAVANGTHIGVAEVDPTNLMVDFADSTAVVLTEALAPTVTNDNDLNTVSGMDTTMEYRLDGASYVAYDFDTFSTINFAGIHTLLVRVAAVADVSNASPETTLNFTYAHAAPAAPAVTSDDINNVILGLDNTMEFSVDSASYVKYDGSNEPDLSGDHTVSVRVAGNLSTDTPTGDVTILSYTENVAPTVTGVEDGMYYKNNLTITFSGTGAISATLDGVSFGSGDIVSGEGTHVLIIADSTYGDVTINFTIDKTAPSFDGMVDGAYSTGDVTITFNDINLESAKLNSDDVGLETVISNEGVYTLVVTDLAGNISITHFTIDKTQPSIDGIDDGYYYSDDVTIAFTDANLASATLDGDVFTTGSTVSAEGLHTLVVTDLAGNTTTVTFTIDTTDPLVTGVTNGSTYNNDVTITFSDANPFSATLNGDAFTNGTTVSLDGLYILIVTDMAGNSTTINFTIDKTIPSITGITDGSYYSSAVTISFSGTNIVSATLDGVDITSGTVVAIDGDYVFVLVDSVQGAYTINFTIDKTSPVVSGVIDGAYYNDDQTITFSDVNLLSATINGANVISGATISTEGSYALVVIDLAGNTTTVNFVIDKTSPVVTGIIDNSYYNHGVTINFYDLNIESAKLNGIDISDGFDVIADGIYSLTVVDLAGNSVTIDFVIDSTAPAISGITDNAYYNNDVVISFSDTNLVSAKLNGVDIASGLTVSAEGSYTLVVTDLAGNSTTIDFTIDKTLPSVTGVIDSNYYNNDVTISFSDLNIAGAKLNGVDITSGYVVSIDGSYSLVVTDLAGNSVTVSFVIDKTQPTISGVTNGAYYAQDVTLVFSDVNLFSSTLNGVDVTSGLVVSVEGSYSLVVTDLAGNANVINFIIDKTNPIISGVSNNAYYSSDAILAFSDINLMSAKLNGVDIASNLTVSADGTYVLVVTDLAGNTTTVDFVIDKTSPVVTGVAGGAYYNSGVTIGLSDINIASATLNGAVFIPGATVSDEGLYELVASDLAGNITKLSFVIDKTAPTVVGVTDGSTYKFGVTPAYNDSNLSGATLNGVTYFASMVDSDGSYSLIVTDKAGNSTIVSFTIAIPKPVSVAVAAPNDDIQSTTPVVTDITTQIDESQPVSNFDEDNSSNQIIKNDEQYSNKWLIPLSLAVLVFAIIGVGIFFNTRPSNK